MENLFVPKETCPGETRVAATPETVARYVKLGLKVAVQAGAGEAACFADEAYEHAGATVVPRSAPEVAAIVPRIQAPSSEELRSYPKGSVVLAVVLPATRLELVRELADHGLTCFAMDLVPRITRAQSMDILSSQATVAGYKAVILAASHLRKLCPLLMTAAGTVTPARAVIFGAGVAGLQAIATAKRLGCHVEATDIRMAAKEQVESLGARFIDVPGMEDMEGEGGYAKEVTPEFLAKQREEVAKRVAEADFVITTAQVPGRPAPKLMSEELVKSMKLGSVIVDLAVDSGGNCELSSPGEVVERHGVTIVGTSNLPATVPVHASELYSKNVLALLRLMFDRENRFRIDLEDEVLAGCILTHEGAVRHQPTRELMEKTGTPA